MCVTESSSIPILPFSVDEGGGSIAVWVASGLDVIPDGSIIINPDTGTLTDALFLFCIFFKRNNWSIVTITSCHDCMPGKPHLNADGSIFRWKSAQVCRSDVNTANTEQPSISPPTNMATDVSITVFYFYIMSTNQCVFFFVNIVNMALVTEFSYSLLGILSCILVVE